MRRKVRVVRFVAFPNFHFSDGMHRLDERPMIDRTNIPPQLFRGISENPKPRDTAQPRPVHQDVAQSAAGEEAPYHDANLKMTCDVHWADVVYHDWSADWHSSIMGINKMSCRTLIYGVDLTRTSFWVTTLPLADLDKITARFLRSGEDARLEFSQGSDERQSLFRS